MINQKGEILLYQSDDGDIKLDVALQGETVWLSQKDMAHLFDCSTDNISLHLKNIFKIGELEKDAVTEDFSVTASDGKNYQVIHYDLDAIISVGYRVNSIRGTEFRKWATKRLREYIIKGFTLNDERFKKGGGINYFNELQDRIREIRLSERFFYQKIKDIYTTSIDYDSKNPQTIEFFKIVQNKLLWAVSKKTAAELVYKRVDASLPLLGMQSFDKQTHINLRKSDVNIAKNYLDEEEIKLLGLLVEQYLAFSETMAQQHKVMYMKDWAKKLDNILQLNGREILTHAGKIKQEQAKEKSQLEYQKYKTRQKDVEREQSLKEIERDIKNLKK